MHVYFSGIIVGIILLQTAVFAPTLFRTLDADSAGRLVRALFPKFFLILAILGGLQLLSLGLSGSGSSLAFAGAAISTLCPIICRAMIPATNKARDEKQHARFKTLHRMSVILTVLVLITNLVMPWLPTLSDLSAQSVTPPVNGAPFVTSGERRLTHARSVTP